MTLWTESAFVWPIGGGPVNWWKAKVKTETQLCEQIEALKEQTEPLKRGLLWRGW